MLHGETGRERAARWVSGAMGYRMKNSLSSLMGKARPMLDYQNLQLWLHTILCAPSILYLQVQVYETLSTPRFSLFWATSNRSNRASAASFLPLVTSWYTID